VGADRMVRQWVASVNALLGSLHGHTLKALALFSLAVCRGGHCQSGRLAAWVVSGALVASSRRRWERLLANPRWDGRAALAELSRAVLAPWGGRRLLLVLDETPGRGDLRSMRLGVCYRKRLLTLAAEVYPKDRPPRRMPALIGRMLREVAPLLPAGASVTLLCDRGLAWPSVMDQARRLGWDHVLRLQGQTKVELPGGRRVAARQLVRRRGGRWHGPARVFKKGGWRDVVLSVVWDERSREPWVLAATPDGRRGLRAAEAYAKRAWCEQAFRDEKSGGFRWDDSLLGDPGRLLKLIVVMALATLLSLSLGTWLVKRGRRGELDPHRTRRLSIFSLGLRWLCHLWSLSKDGPVPSQLPYLYPT
jgi:hypothetical protein